MYESFHIRHFKCFRDLHVESLRPLTVITGANNVGKSALLEALFVHSGAGLPNLLLIIAGFRGLEQLTVEFGRWSETPLADFFYNFNTSIPIEFEGRLDHQRSRLRISPVTDPQILRTLGQATAPIGGSPEGSTARPPVGFTTTSSSGTASSARALSPGDPAHVLSLRYESDRGEATQSHLIMTAQGVRFDPVLSPSPPFFSIHITTGRVSATEDAERFSKLEVSRQVGLLVESLQVIEPRLKELKLAVRGGAASIHADVGLERLLPLSSMGDGMRRLSSLVLAIATASNGVVFLDEVENGLHYSVLAPVWRAIYEAARLFNTQVVLTTHSLECLRALGTVVSQQADIDFTVCRLERQDGDIRAVSYDREAFLGATEGGLEIR